MASESRRHTKMIDGTCLAVVTHADLAPDVIAQDGIAIAMPAWLGGHTETAAVLQPAALTAGVRGAIAQEGHAAPPGEAGREIADFGRDLWVKLWLPRPPRDKGGRTSLAGPVEPMLASVAPPSNPTCVACRLPGV